MPAAEIVTGTVKWFNAEKGFGFITTASHGALFVHLRALAEGRASLNAGEAVYFNLRETPKGLEAANVRVGAPPPPPKPAQPSVDLPATAAPAQVRMRVVARPAEVHELERARPHPGWGNQSAGLIAFTVDLPPEAAPASPGLPARGGASPCLVLISARHWPRASAALDADPQDALIVDGYAGLDPVAPGMVVLRATSVSTVALARARSAADAERTRARAATIAEATPAGDDESPEDGGERRAASGESVEDSA